jgi:hypothetical protein
VVDVSVETDAICKRKAPAQELADLDVESFGASARRLGFLVLVLLQQEHHLQGAVMAPCIYDYVHTCSL